MTMRLKKSLSVIMAFTLLLILSGCSKKEPPNLDVQKNIVHTYLEGLRDHNKEKIYKTVNVALKIKTLDPDFKKSFESFDQSVGKIKSWVLEDKGSWVDEVNGQSLIKAKLSTTKKKVLPLDIDLRKDGDRWVVYTVRISESGKMNPDKNYFDNPHNKKDNSNKSDNNKASSTDKSSNTNDADKPKNQ